MAHWLYLSPHFDDAVFSCGGLIRDQVDRGDTVEIWTVCAGDPPPGGLSVFAEELHARWNLGREVVVRRRAEDLAACTAVGAAARHLHLMDCIYRRDPRSLAYLYGSEEAIFGKLAEMEIEMLVPALAAVWQREIADSVQLVSPLAVGNHVDHQLVRRAAERLGRPLRYYADAPYVFAWESAVPDLLPAGAVQELHSVSERGMLAWLDGNAAYASQISSFWGDWAEMEETFREQFGRIGGVRLWKAEPLPGVEPGSRT